MGTAGVVVSFTFFFLMGIAALTSSISMLEVPVAYVIEEHGFKRKTAVYAIGGIIAVASSTILLNFENLFGLVVAFTTRYSQPVLGFMFCIYAGWVWHRDTLLQELRKGNPEVEQGLFWKIWPWYVKLVCPVIILGIFAQSLWG
jgi:NSS family neurotransmitter:Na+ symporter